MALPIANNKSDATRTGRLPNALKGMMSPPTRTKNEINSTSAKPPESVSSAVQDIANELAIHINCVRCKSSAMTGSAVDMPFFAVEGHS